MGELKIKTIFECEGKKNRGLFYPKIQKITFLQRAKINNNYLQCQ